MIRLRFYPKYEQDNQYIELFYKALEPYGVYATDDLNPWDKNLLRELAPSLDVIHIQWCPELIWREWGKSRPRDFRQVVRFWRFLRLARGLGIRVVWTVHDFQHHEGDRLVDHIGYRILARAADLCICHSETVRGKVIRKFGAPPRNTVVMPIGNYEGVYGEPRPRTETLAGLGIPEEKRVLVSFGRLRHYKGIDTTLDALPELGDDYHFILIGKPIEASYGQQIADRVAGLPNVTAILDEVEVQRLADLIGAADCVLLPYKQITGSSALLAALTLGRGVVTSDLVFFTEILAKGPEAGTTFRASDAADLVRAVRAYFEVPTPRRHEAARRLSAQYSWPQVIRPVAEWFAREFPGKGQLAPDEMALIGATPWHDASGR